MSRHVRAHRHGRGMWSLSLAIVAATAFSVAPHLAIADEAATPAATQPAVDGQAEGVPDNAPTSEKILMFVKPGTMMIGRIDLERCDPREALDLLCTMIRNSPADVPLKAKLAASLQRDGGREMGEFIQEVRDAGVTEMIQVTGSPMGFDPESMGTLYRLREGADQEAALRALKVNQDYMHVSVEAGFIVTRYNFGRNGALKPMMNAAKSNRAEVLKAIELAGDAPASVIIVPPPGSLNAAKLAMPTLPDYLGGVETKDLIDGVESLVMTGDPKEKIGRATVVCANPQVFADAVKKLRTGAVAAFKNGSMPTQGMPVGLQRTFEVLLENAPELEVKDGLVELNVDESIAQKNLDAILPHLVESFKENARWENERNMRTLLEAVNAFAEEHGDALPRTFTDLKPHLSEKDDLAVLTVGLLDDKPYVYRRPAGAGLLAPLRSADNVILIHEDLDGRPDDETISYGLTNGAAASCTVGELKASLSKGTLRLADSGGGQGG